MREYRGYLDALAREQHTEQKFLWDMHRNLVLAGGHTKPGDIREYPDYEGPEEGQLPDNWEEVASASPLVTRVAVPSQQEPSPGDLP